MAGCHPSETRAASRRLSMANRFSKQTVFSWRPGSCYASEPTARSANASTRRSIAADSDGGGQLLSCSTMSQPSYPRGDAQHIAAGIVQETQAIAADAERLGDEPVRGHGERRVDLGQAEAAVGECGPERRSLGEAVAELRSLVPDTGDLVEDRDGGRAWPRVGIGVLPEDGHRADRSPRQRVRGLSQPCPRVGGVGSWRGQ